MMSYCDPDCPICHGSGLYAKYDGDDIHHPDFGRLYECPEYQRRRWSEDMGINRDEVPSLNWDKFLPTQVATQLKELFTGIIEKGYGWAYVYGPPGIGKTKLAKAAVVQARHKHGLDARYMMHVTMLNRLRSAYDEENGQKAHDNLLRAYTTIPFLVIDEVGRDRGTSYGVSILSELLNIRYEGAVNRKTVTIMLSNFAPEAVLDGYQVDRIKDKRFNLLKLEGESVRKVLTYEQSSLLEDTTDWWQDL